MIKSFATALGLAGLLAGASLAQDNIAVPESEPVSEPVAAPIGAPDWSDLPAPIDLVCPFEFDYEPGEVSCGFVTVPENRSNPDSRLIRVHYVKLAATAEDPADIRPDPVIYLTGGPGVAVESYANRLREHDILEQRDLYILEQRGIANSGDLCPHYGAVRRELAWGETGLDVAANEAERTRTCFQAATAAGVDLSAYNTFENAHDVRDLRIALGYESWNVWGISYGSHLGQMLLNVDSAGTRALVIDAIVPNDLDDLMRLGRYVSRLMDNVFTTCEGDAICEGLRPRYEAAIDQLKAEPVIIDVDDVETYPQGQVRFGAEILIFAPFMMMYEQDQHAAIPAVMDSLTRAVETGDYTVFELLANSGFDFGGGGGMSDAIRCNDGYTAASAEVMAEDLAENPIFQNMGLSAEGAALAAQVCVDEGLSPLNGTENYQLIQSDVPTLIVNGAWDPITPPPLAERILPGFTNGRYIEVPYAGHGPTRSMPECAGPVLNAFFDTLDPAGLDASCLETGVTEPEFIEVYSTSALLRAGVMAMDDPKSLAPSALWLGLPLIALLISLLAYPAGFLARVIDGQSAQSLSADTGGARLLGLATALTGLAFPALILLGGYKLNEISMVGLIAGLGMPAAKGAWMALASGGLGLLSLILLWRTQMSDGRIRIGTLIGLTLTGLSGLALAGFAGHWDLLPF